MTTELPEGAAEAVTCPKCGGSVELPADLCPHCRRHLYIKCDECEATNFRGRDQCRECGARLKHTMREVRPRIHRHLWPIRWSFDRRRKWLLPVQIVLFVASVSLASYATIKIVEYRRHRPTPEPPEVYVLEDGKLTPLEDVMKR